MNRRLRIALRTVGAADRRAAKELAKALSYETPRIGFHGFEPVDNYANLLQFGGGRQAGKTMQAEIGKVEGVRFITTKSLTRPPSINGAKHDVVYYDEAKKIPPLWPIPQGTLNGGSKTLEPAQELADALAWEPGLTLETLRSAVKTMKGKSFIANSGWMALVHADNALP